MKQKATIIAILFLFMLSAGVKAQDKYFMPASKEAATPDEEGFIRRWFVLEPISKPNHTNTVFTDTYLNKVFAEEYFRNQMTIIPKDGEKVRAKYEKVEMPKDYRRIDPSTLKTERGTETLKWHKLDSKSFNLKLLRFGEHNTKRLYGVLYWVVTTIKCYEDINNVRLSVGSNSASKWWINGADALLLSGDRRMVVDDAMSQRLNLKKGDNVIRGAIINGPGMSDFCVRLVNEKGEPITKGFTIK